MKYEEVEVIQLLQQLVRIESTNEGTYEKEIGDFIYSWLKDQTAGTEAEVFRDEALPGRCNIVGYLKGEFDHPNMVLIAHMDTVPVGNGWTKDPFGAEISEDGKMYGRGTSDMKGGLAAAMIAFRDFVKSGIKPKHTLVFIGSVDEENKMSGSQQAVKSGWIQQDSWVLDTEPTGGYVIGSHKGKIWFKIKTMGKPAHSSMPEMGVDAIAAMGEIISELQKRISQYTGTTSMGPSTVCYGTINGGVNANVVSDCCTLTIDMRITPPLTGESSIQLVEEAIKAGTAKVPGAVGSYEITSQKPCIVLEEDSMLLKAVKNATKNILGKEALTYFMAGYTDSGVATAETGCVEAMSYGAMGVGTHQADEYVFCDSVIKLVDVLGEVVREMIIV